MRSFLALFLMFLCSPIWVLVEVKSLYTCLHNFYCSNVAFWHVAVLSMPLYAPIIRNQPNCLWPVFLYFVLLPIFVGWAFEIPRRYKPKVQKLSHIILGLFGEILVVWIMLGCTLAIQMHYYSEIIWPICCLFVISSFFFSIDAYSCLFTDSYSLCVHRESEEEMLRKNPINGIICNVAIRSKYSKKEKLLPDGYQFDDELNFLSLLNMV
ncbi:hypothetical protein B9Z55_004909 [Caenorhabditis nigoni]|uniref:Uncharacterized protein n=1 Tax=Caenorhabditis nigoni TaxID=1611254 RepID=A0A2G5UYJ2_9PELO|nr:hypothetical protein B9Z55_004909 [Caenorhabditis nigoni]